MSQKYRYTLRIHIHDFDCYISQIDQKTLTGLVTHCIGLNFGKHDCLPFSALESEYFDAIEAFGESAFISNDDADFLLDIMQEYAVPPVERVIFSENILYVFVVL